MGGAPSNYTEDDMDSQAQARMIPCHDRSSSDDPRDTSARMLSSTALDPATATGSSESLFHTALDSLPTQGYSHSSSSSTVSSSLFHSALSSTPVPDIASINSGESCENSGGGGSS
eukprot:scpid90379/ scgid14032/ 